MIFHHFPMIFPGFSTISHDFPMVFPMHFPCVPWKPSHPTPIHGAEAGHGAVQRQHRFSLGEDLGRGRVAAGGCTAAGRSPGIFLLGNGCGITSDLWEL